MKRIGLCSIALVLLLAMVGCSSTEQPNSSKPNTIAPDNSTVDIDTSSITRIEKTGCISVSTDSIKGILTDTGRFEIAEIPQLGGVDVICGLDKENGESIAGIIFTVLDDNTTTMISYNFSKDAIQGKSKDPVRWGLDILLRILGDSLSDDTWDDILAIAEKSESVGGFGTDHEGYSNPDAGIIELIYADLGNNVQIDIRPYNS